MASFFSKADGGLTERTGFAVACGVVGNLLDVGLALGVGIALARLLPPVEFGRFGIVLAVVGPIELLTSAGLAQALVQRESVESEHVAAAMTLQMLLAIVCSLLLVSAAPVIESIFGVPGTAGLVWLMAASLPLSALGLGPQAVLARNLEFGRITTADLAMRAARGSVGIALALSGWGASALAIGWVAGSAVRTLLMWILVPRRPTLTGFRRRHAVDLFHFSVGMTWIALFNDLTRRLDLAIMAMTQGAVPLGLYQRAFQLVLMPFAHMTAAVNRALFPALSSVVVQPERFKRGYLAAVRATSMATYPCLVVMALASDLIIPLLYGEAWREAVPFARILVVAVAIRVAYNTHGLVTQSHGQVTAEARRQLLFLVTLTLFAFVGSRFGPLGIAAGVVASGAVFLAIMTPLALGIAGITAREWLVGLRTGVMSSVFMAVSMQTVKVLLALHVHDTIVLAVMLFVGFVVYGLAVRSLATAIDRDVIEQLCEQCPRRVRRFVRTMMLGGAMTQGQVP